MQSTQPNRFGHRSDDVPWGISSRERATIDELLSGVLLRSGPRLAGPAWRVLNGGKRLRPAVTVAAAGRRDAAMRPATAAGAAAVEMLHWATLVHDDVLDQADSRHGQPTVNAREGLGQAVVTGDLLIGAAFELAGRVGTEAVATLAVTLTDLCVGQTDEAARRFDTSVTEADALTVARAKTGSLLAAAARIGAQSADFDICDADGLAEFGMSFGVCLQILDDVLDLVSSPERLGKPVGADFVNGTMTLPSILALAEHPELHELARPGLDDTERAHALKFLRDGDVIADAVARACDHADAAAAALGPLTETHPYMVALAGWPHAYLDAQLAARVEPELRPLLRESRLERRVIA